VPSFGDWGFVVGLKRPAGWEDLSITVPTRFLDGATLRGLFLFEKDLVAPKTGEPVVSTLDHPSVLDLYLKGWRHWH
jgi:spermidine synthase